MIHTFVSLGSNFQILMDDVCLTEHILKEFHSPKYGAIICESSFLNKHNVVPSKPILLLDKFDTESQSHIDSFLKLHNSNTLIFGIEKYICSILKISTHIHICFHQLKQSQSVSDPIFFPLNSFETFSIQSYESCSKHSAHWVTYKSCEASKSHDERQYLNELQDILDQGKRRPDRTQVGTLSVFGRQLRFDLSKEFPLLTTKFVSWKAVLKELLWFLKGGTDSKTLEKDNINIWKANTSREFLDSRGLAHYKEGDIGPMYGWVWRHHGACYAGCDASYKNCGFDQLEWVINNIKTNPYCRRHLITTFSPTYNDQGTLVPCHGIVTQFYVDTKDNIQTLSSHTYCRSQDTFLGQPFNIASYALLTMVIATMCGMQYGELIISTGDTHIYQTHIKQVTTQLQRNPLPFPILEINPQVSEKKLEDLIESDFKLIGYLHHPSIKADMAV